MLALKPSVIARLPSRPAMSLQRLGARSPSIVELSPSAAFRNLNISVRRSMQTLAASSASRTRVASLSAAPNYSVFNYAFHSVLKDPAVQNAFGVAMRSVFTTSKRRLYALEKDADQHPQDVNKQLALLRELVKENPHRVTARLESRRYAVDDAIFLEYMKALAKANRFQHHRDMNELRRRITPIDSGMDYSAQYASPDSQAQQQYSTAYPNQYPADYSAYSAYPQQQPYGYPPQQYGQPDPYAYAQQPVQQQQQQRKDDDDEEDSPKRKLGFMGYMSQMAGRLFSMVVYIVLFLTITSAFLYYFGGGKTGMGSLGPLTDSKVKEIVPQNANVRFSDVKGCDEAKEELKEVVEFLKNPEKFTRLGGQLPKGILMTGPPGTGKTLLAKAVAGEAGVPFFYSSGSEFEEMYVGVGARRVRDLFTAAKRKAPCLIFIDEIDAVGGTRRLKEQQAMRMTLNQLLVELDGFSDSKGIIVIGATNFPELLDKALVRPGRFDRHIAVPLPDVKGRKEILDLYLQKVPKATDVNTLVLARGTPGCSGADLFNLVNSAAVQASVKNENAVSMGHLEWAKDKILMGAERKSAVMTDQVKKLTAYHEGGHALVAMNTSGAHPIHKATIMPRGRALGMVHQLPEHDVVSVSKAQLLAQLDVCMGGRVAEELIFGPDNVTTGASSDLSKATNIARGMVIEYGMSEKVGPLRIAEKDLDKLSPDTRKVIDEEVRQIVDASYARAKKLLTDKEKDLHVLAKALLKYETLSSDEIRTVLANKPLDRSITN